MGCQPSKTSERYVAHGAHLTPCVQAALRSKSLTNSDLLYWWQLTPLGFRKLQCSLAKGYVVLPLVLHLSVGQCILSSMKANLTGGLVILAKDRIFKVQVRGENVLSEGHAGNQSCGCCCGGAEWEMDLATNAGTAQPSELLCLPTIKLGGIENPPQFFCHDTVFAQRLIADAKKKALRGGRSVEDPASQDSDKLWLRVEANDPAARLVKAKALFEQGTIGADEFGDKKRDLLRLL